MNYLEMLSSFQITDIKSVNTYTALPRAYPMVNNGRANCGFLYTLHGNETYHFSDMSVSATQDSVLFIPLGEKYNITFEGDISVVRVIDFYLNTNFYPRPFCVKCDRNSSVSSLFSDAEKCWNKKNTAYSVECKAYFYNIVTQLVKIQSNYLNSKSYLKIIQAVNFLHENYTNPDFRIKKLYEISDITPKYFDVLFKKKFSTTPKEYVTALRISRAKELLSNEKNRVDDVALQLGYCDAYHFSKTFKSKTGYTPKEYRNIK